jgi:hypothetical protein
MGQDLEINEHPPDFLASKTTKDHKQELTETMRERCLILQESAGST